MSYSFYFVSSFRRSLKSLKKKYSHVKADTRTAWQVLETSPQLGDVIPGSGRIRKLRIPNSDAARGKSSGYRLSFDPTAN
jgi:mRNA-degrading endonuclease RelE of RelBE toxin-antitoxin system